MAKIEQIVLVLALFCSVLPIEAATLTTYPFIPYPQGMNLMSSPIVASDGNLYGTTEIGGVFGYGCVYKLTPEGDLTVLFNFNNTDGANPYGGLIEGNDGNFYGTTEAGGSSNDGTVFQLTPSGKLTTLVNFNGMNGANPYAGVVQGGDGNFYGTTLNGGAFSEGTAFKVTPGGTLTTVIEFNYANGAAPQGGLILANDGNLYGTTLDGGSGANAGSGTLYEIASDGTVTTNLVNFTAGPIPGPLAEASDGTLYGVTNVNSGLLFAVTTAGACTSIALDGANGLPNSPLVEGIDGNFYGTLNPVEGSTSGTVFKLTKSGVLTDFANFEGFPLATGAALVEDKQGNLYGTTGASVFKVTPNGVATTLETFKNVAGACPAAGVIEGSDGNFYGTTTFGTSPSDPLTSGTVFQMTPGNLPTSLVTFTAGLGSHPEGQLCQGSDGNLYGTCEDGGGSNYGTVFRVTTGGTLTTLVQFNDSNGAFPYGGVIQATDGNFYGTTSVGGTGNTGYGTVFSMTPTGTLTTLVQFNGTNGATPLAPLIQGSDGAFYGTTAQGGGGDGTVFKVTSDGTLTTLSLFLQGGSYSDAPLLQDANGNLYGTTQLGGSGSNSSPAAGTLFKIAAGVPTILANFVRGVSGVNPQGSLVQDSDGNFICSTASGGSYNGGTLSQVTPDGALTTLISFNTWNGNDPGSLILGTDGNIYGTTDGGGSANVGTVFRLETSSSKTVTFASPSDLPLVVPAYTINGSSLNLTLGYAPSPGDVLTVVRSTGWVPIIGAFTNIPDGGTYTAVYGCNAYSFIASYSGGSGNDLTLTLQSKNYSAWSTAHNFTGGIADPPGSDGVSNLLKYLFDINPSTPMSAADHAAMPTSGIDTTSNPGTEYLTLTYRQNASATGITVNVLTSTDLKSWAPPSIMSVYPMGTDSATGDPIMQVKVPVNGATEFIRLSVTQP